jgi:hypothetical protein
LGSHGPGAARYQELSDTVSISTAPQEIASEDFEDVVLVTSVARHRSSEVFLVTKEDGAVYIHETKSSTKIQKLFSHTDSVATIC